MAGYVQACIKAVEDYTNGMDAFHEKEKELDYKFKHGEMSSNYYKEQREQIRGTDGKLREKLAETIYKERDTYIGALERRYRKDVSTVDQSDMFLLTNDVVELSPDDLKSMFDRYLAADNLGMCSIIVDVNEKRLEDHASLTFYDRETRERDAKIFADQMIGSGVAGGLRAAFAVEGKLVPASLINE